MAETRDDVEETFMSLGVPAPTSTPVRVLSNDHDGDTMSVYLTPRSAMKMTPMVQTQDSLASVPRALSDLKEIVGDEEARYFSDLEEAQMKNAELRESLKAYDMENARLNAELDNVRMHKECLEKDRDFDAARLATENEMLKEEKESLEKQRDEQQELLQRMRADREAFEKGHEEQKEKWKSLVISMKCEYDKMVESDRKSKEENESFKSNLDSLKICKEVAESEYKEAKEKWQQTVQQMQEEFDGLKSAIAEQEVESEKKLAALTAEYDALKQASEGGARNAAEEFGKKIKEIQAERDSLQSELNSFQLCRSVSHEEHIHKQEVWEEKVAGIQSEYDALMASMIQLRSEYEDTKATYQAQAIEVQHAQKMQPVYEKMKSQFMELKSAYEAQAVDLDRLTVAQEHADASLKEMKEAWKQESYECDKVKSMLANLQEDYDGRLQEMEAHKVEREAWELLKNGYDSLMTEHDILLSGFADVKTTVVAYQEEKGQLAKEVANILAVNEALMSNLEVLKLEVDSVIESKMVAEEKVKEIQFEYDTLMSNFQTVDAAAKKAADEHQFAKELFQKKISKANKGVETKKEALSMALQRYLTEVEAKQAAEESVSELEVKLQKATAMNQELEESVAAMNKYISAKDNELDDLQSRFSHLQQSMELVVEEYKLTLEKKKAMEKKHQEEQMSSLQEIAALKEDIANKDDEIKKAQNESTALTKLAERKEAEVLSARCENDTLRATLDEAREEIEKGKQRCTQVQAEAQAQIAEIEEHLSTFNKTIAKKEAEIKASEARCDNLRASLTEMKKSRDADVEEMQQRISAMNHKVAQKITALNAAEIELGRLRADLDAANDMIEKLENKNDDVRKNAMYSREIMTKQENEIELMRSRCDSLQWALEESEEFRQTEVDRREAAEKLRDSQQAEAKIALLRLKEIVEHKDEEIRRLREAANFHMDETEMKVIEMKMLVDEKDAEIKELKGKTETMKNALQKARDVYLVESHKKADTDRKISEEHKAALDKVAFLEELVQNKESEVELIISRCESIQASLANVEKRHQEQIEFVKKGADKKIDELAKAEKRHQEQLELVKKGAEDKINKLSDAISSKQRQLADSAPVEVVLDHYQKETAESQDRSATYKAYSTSRIFSLHTLSRDTKPVVDEKKNRWLGLRKRDDASSQGSVNASESREERRARLGLPMKWSFSQTSRAKGSVLDQRGPSAEGARSATGSRFPTSPRKHATTSSKLSAYEETNNDREQDCIQAQIPAHIRSNFLEVGFYKNRVQNIHLPVLCLGPFDVPAGPIRDDWLSKIEKDSKVLSLGVYFYGKTGGAAYGTIPWFSFIPHEKAAQRGLDQTPKQILDKLNSGDALEDCEQELVEGIKLAKAAIAKDPEFRTHPLYHLVDKRRPGSVPDTIVTTSGSQDHGDHVSEIGF